MKYKKLLVTGGCGFIGANFIRYLLEEVKYEGTIINVDKLTYAGNPENLTNIAQKFAGQAGQYVFEKADICDLSKMDSIIETHKVDAICHFAAESHVDRSIKSPDEFIQTNIIGSFNLLELARKYSDSVKIFHHVSTDEVYGSLGETGSFLETTAYSPNSPYSASKASSDHLVRAYYKTFGVPVTISNCSNNYGPYQFPEKLIPLITLNALEGKDLPVYGDGKQVRDWLFVNDHCKAIWLIMNNGRHGQTYNVGGNAEMENITIVETICDILDELAPQSSVTARRALIKFVADRPGHDRRYAIDFTKLKNELGWQPTESFHSGIRKTVSWYLDNHAWVNGIKTGAYRD
ncbi:MAG: dTDP-glucose 4,6-dehydratase, partial [Deltaproteobacteria bacterium]